MKVVINTCVGGFSLSPLAVKNIADRKGRGCYFFSHEYRHEKPRYHPASVDAKELGSVVAFDVPNPNDFSIEELYDQHENDARPENRDDPDLVAVVEDLGEAAWGEFAKLKVVEIPDGVEWEISEYGGLEHVAEKHRTWD